MSKTLIDSNILVYLIEKHEKRKHEIVLNLFKSLRKKQLENEYVISLQTLREFSNIYWKKSKEKNFEDLKENTQLFKDSFEILDEKPEDIEQASKIHFEQKIPFWDALLIAVMQRPDIKEILTENEKDFKKAKIEIINPFK